MAPDKSGATLCSACGIALSASLRSAMLSPLATSFSLFASLTSLTTKAMPWGKRGVLGGKACFASRLPPRVHSEDRFLAEGPLEGPGAT